MRPKLIIPLVLMIISALLQGCIHEENISNRSPYSDLMGKKFVLLQDCYIIRYIKGHGPLYVSNSSSDHFLPKNVSPEYVQKQFERFLIVGVLRKGSVFTIVGCEEERTPMDTFVHYKATFQNSSFQGAIFDLYSLTDDTKNPPGFSKNMARQL